MFANGHAKLNGYTSWTSIFDEWTTGALPVVVVFGPQSRLTRLLADGDAPSGVASARNAHILAARSKLAVAAKGTSASFELDGKRGQSIDYAGLKSLQGVRRQILGAMLLDDYQEFVGGYYWRTMSNAVVTKDYANDKVQDIKLTVHFDVLDVKHNKSFYGYKDRDRQNVANENRPFYPQATGLHYYRWTETIELCFRPDDPVSKFSTRNRQYINDKSIPWEMPMPGKLMVKSDPVTEGNPDELIRPPANYQNGDRAFYDRYIEAIKKSGPENGWK